MFKVAKFKTSWLGFIKIAKNCKKLRNVLGKFSLESLWNFGVGGEHFGKVKNILRSIRVIWVVGVCNC